MATEPATLEYVSTLIDSAGLARGRRALAAATLASAVGNGMYLAVMAVYFTRAAGFSAAGVGAGLTAAGLVGLAAGLPAGRWADRGGPRAVYLGLSLVSAATMASYAGLRSYRLFLAVAVVDSLAASGTRAARGALIARLAGGDPHVYRARLRSVANIGVAAGGLIGGIGLAVDTRAGYATILLLNALTFLGNAVLSLRIPRLAPVPSPPGLPSWPVMRDRRFLAFSGLAAVLAIHDEVLLFAVPLWMSQATDAPRWTIAVLVVVNTLLVASLQLRIGQGVNTIARGARASGRAGWILAAASVLFGVIGLVPGWAVVAVLLVAAATHSIGEIVQQAGYSELSFGLAPEHAQGQYQGLSATFSGAGIALAPGLLGWLCVAGGAAGWLALGGVFAAAGALTPFAVARGKPAPGSQSGPAPAPNPRCGWHAEEP
jgi:MFS family permease